MNFAKFHDKYYKKLLVFVLIVFILSFWYMFSFYSKTGTFFLKDISLTGGTSVTIEGKFNSIEIKENLSGELENLNIRIISDLMSGEQKAIVIQTTSTPEETRSILQNYFGFKLTDENSSFEFTGATLSENFYFQLILAIFMAFLLMGWVVFVLFGKEKNIKFILGIVYILFAILAFKGFFSINVSIYLAISFLVISLIIYFKYNIPSFAIVISAFADIFMTLVMVNLMGIKLSSAGIVAFLMLIGYSVDTDILLTNRILKRGEGSVNSRIFGAFKTGITMTLTSLLAVLSAYFIVKSFSEVLSQIFLILSIGLVFDILNTWGTNVSLIKGYVLRREKNEI